MTFRQPREALKPDGFTLERAEQWALEQTSRLSSMEPSRNRYVVTTGPRGAERLAQSGD